MSRLNVAILWHMHQPCYREPDSRVFRLPWTRLHGLKDYLDMPALALRQPGLKLTFNLVPALLEQLEAYADGSATDQHLELSRRSPEDLAEGERSFLLQEFFMANWENMIRPHPRYWELLNKRGLYFHPSELPALARRFSVQDLMDLQVWFNLAWTDPAHLDNDPALAGLASKGRGFTGEDKALLLERQNVILSSVVPMYRQAMESGAAELCTSPFHHPILPLLCDSDVARECMPQAELPSRFSYPGDAKGQVRRALDFMESRFGSRPRGLWPSEGSVSREVVEMAGGEGLEWLATDEGILERSLGRPLRSNLEPSDPGSLYRPYRLEGRGPEIFFRDRMLSDLIGFTYASWKPGEAAADLVGRLERIADSLGAGAGGRIVPIILDGENAWESYQDDGRGFLESLYQRLCQSAKLETCTFSRFLESGHETGTLGRLHPGSWINGDFGVWIGEKEDNRAWELLLGARRTLEAAAGKLDRETLLEAEEEISIAEGSDWCWWYGGNFDSEHLAQFDRLFRSHVLQVYRLLGKAPPEAALVPIITAASSERLINEPIDVISPLVDGRSTDFFEWAGAGKLDTSIQGGTMHRSQSLIRTVYYGFDNQRLYLRLDPAFEIASSDYPELNVLVDFIKPAARQISFHAFKGRTEGEGPLWAFDRLIEISIPFAEIGAGPSETVYFFVRIRNDSLELEKHPGIQAIKVTVPDEKYILQNWQA